MNPDQAAKALRDILMDKGTNLSLQQQSNLELAIVIFEDLIHKVKVANI